MTKYQPLENYLENRGTASIHMSFDDIESVIKDDLPASARKHRAWWSNNPSNSVITYAWLAAGYKTSQVDLEGETLVFYRVEKTPRSTPSAATPPGSPHPIFGCLEGLITIPADLDLTQPADPERGENTYENKDA